MNLRKAKRAGYKTRKQLIREVKLLRQLPAQPTLYINGISIPNAESI